MREQHRNPKSASQLSRYKPALDTLEDRSMPGNALIGLTGFALPFSITSAQKALTSTVNRATTPAAAAKVASEISTEITPSKNISSLVTGGKQAIQNAIAPSSIAPIQGGNNGTSMSFSSSTPDSFDAIMNRVLGNSSNPTTTGSGVGGLGIWSGPNAGISSITKPSGNSGVPQPNSSSTPGANHSIYTLSEFNDGAFDTRGAIRTQFGKGGLDATQLAAASVLDASVTGGLSYSVDSTFGTPRSIIGISGTLTGPQVGTPLSIVTQFIKDNAAFLGLSQSDINAVKNVETLKWSVGNGSMLYFQQFVNGIAVDGSLSGAGVRPDGSLVILNNAFIPNIVSSVNTQTPVLTGPQAIINAALDAGITIKGALTKTTPVGTEQVPTYLNSSISNDPIPVKLSYLSIAPGQTRLVYNTRIFVPYSTHLLEINVDAVTGQVWNRMNWIAGDSYRVFKPPVETPADGGRVLVTNPADKVASPFGWHDTNGKTGAEYTYTRGNNVYARYGPNSDPAGMAGPVNLTGTAVNGVNGNNYDFPLNLNNPPQTYANAATTQLFYSTNFYHDVLYRAGFTENAGNFQQNNYGKTQTNRQNDQILAYASASSNLGLFDNAYFVPANDGTSGRVAMFLWDIGQLRDGDLDNQIIFHEMTHGTSTRLVGGSTTAGDLSGTFEARGLGEGYSDFMALLLTMKSTDNKTTKITVGNYVTSQPESGPGIRNYPYSYDMSISPYTYSDFDPAESAHGDGNGGYSFYTMGEIWVNALNDMTLNLVEHYGFSNDLINGTAGNNIALKLVTAGMALTAQTPSALDARNGILAADMFLYGGAHLSEIWAAMARRGLGSFARAGTPDPQNPATAPPVPLTLIEDFTVPDGLPDPGNGNPDPGNPPVGGDGSKDSLYEPNETANKAFDLGTVTGKLDVNDLQIKKNPAGQAADRDWFKFTPTTAGTLTLTMTPNTTAGDLDVRLYRSTNGSPTNLTEIGIAQGTHRVAGGVETITVAVGAGITYYFNTAGFNGGLGNYNLNINAPS